LSWANFDPGISSISSSSAESSSESLKAAALFELYSTISFDCALLPKSAKASYLFSIFFLLNIMRALSISHSSLSSSNNAIAFFYLQFSIHINYLHIRHSYQGRYI
jgi:hypothetical protein